MRSEYKNIREEKVTIRKFVEVILSEDEAEEFHAWLDENVSSKELDEGNAAARFLWELHDSLYC
jgi:hypothetical protein